MAGRPGGKETSSPPAPSWHLGSQRCRRVLGPSVTPCARSRFGDYLFSKRKKSQILRARVCVCVCALLRAFLIQMLRQAFKKLLPWGAWVAPSVKRPTSAQVMISRSVGSSPVWGSVLTAQSLEPASDSVSPSLSAPPLLILCLSFSQKYTWNIKQSLLPSILAGVVPSVLRAITDTFVRLANPVSVWPTPLHAPNNHIRSLLHFVFVSLGDGQPACCRCCRGRVWDSAHVRCVLIVCLALFWDTGYKGK